MTQQTDRTAALMRYAIAFLVISILCVLLYGLVAGVLLPPAPRTLVESAVLRSETAVQQGPGDGRAWAALAGARWSAGDREGARSAIDQGKKLVKDASILFVHNVELDLLLIEGRDEEVLKRVDNYLATEQGFRSEEASRNAARGITVPEAMLSNTTEYSRLFVLKATAQGNLGRWEEAVASLDQAFALNDKAADVLTLRGWAKLRAGDKVGAAADFEAALRFMPDDPSASEGLEQARGG